jgi:hypothetical protein
MRHLIAYYRSAPAERVTYAYLHHGRIVIVPYRRAVIWQALSTYERARNWSLS